MDWLAHMQDELHTLLAGKWVSNIVFSAVLILLIAGTRLLVIQIFLRHLSSAEDRKRLISTTRNLAVLLLVAALAAVWANALQSFLLSVLALVAAFIIATKELLLCLSGSFLRVANSAYSLGDRIRWCGVYGDVVDISLLTTTLLEAGPEPSYYMPTGRTVVIPNAKMLDSPLINESRTGPYAVHTVRIPLTADDDLERAHKVALEAIYEVCGNFVDEARTWLHSLEHSHNFVHTPSAGPRIHVYLPEPGKVDLYLRFPTPSRMQGRMEQAVVRRFLRQYHGSKIPLSVNLSPEEVI
jgi:small-conductance mechanosensitive channel